MFTSARVKLTVWYLLIIMFVSSLFSLVIYRMLSNEIERFARTQRVRIQRQLGNYMIIPVPVDEEIITDARHRVGLFLIALNGIILALSGSVGYFLAGRTLKPIQEMVDEQNRFIADASHELRTPLTSLKSTIEVSLRDKRLTLKDAKEALSSNLEEVNQLHILSDALLQLAQFRKPSGNRLMMEAIRVKDVLEEAVRRVAPLAKTKKINITTHISDANVVADRSALLELFVILLDNAVKYSPQSSGIGVSSTKSGTHIAVNIRDEGIGISEEELPHIFDRFYRADKSRSKENVTGYGLGLSIAKEIVDLHNGSIDVSRNEGPGVTFTVRLTISTGNKA